MPLPSIKDDQILDQIKTTLGAIQAGVEYRNTFDKIYKEFSGDYAAVPERYKIIGNIRFVDDSQLEFVSETVEDISALIDIDLILKSSNNILELKSDVLKAIGNDVTLNLAFDTRYEGATKNKIDHYGNKISDLTITIRVTYRRNAWSK